MIQYILNGKEYTTRHRLAEKYNLSKTGGLVQRTLESNELTHVQERNQIYYLKDEVEPLIEKALKRK